MVIFKRIVKVLKYGALAAAVGCTTILLHNNDWKITSLGAVRFGRAATTAAAIVGDYKKTLNGLDPATQHYWDVKSELHRRSAEKLRDLCCINGGVFIKVGQHLGALEYLLPIEYVDTMKVLHSDAPQSPVEDMYKVIEEDFGRKVGDVFTSFEAKPIGAASLAQVHGATLKDGTRVAVKVQHRRVKAHSFVDMATMELLVHLVAWVFPEFQMMWVAEEAKINLPLELDFAQEGRNCERVSRMFRHFHFLKVPKIYWDLTTERVLTMEYCDGGQVNNKEYMEKHNISVDEVSKKLGLLYSEMIFEQGYIHCDPHPGNVLVNNVDGDTQIVLLDHGLYQTLTDDFRLNYCKLWGRILKADVSGIKKYSERLGIGRLYPLFACIVTARSWKAVSKGVDKEAFSQDEDNEIKSSAAQYLPEISDILNNVPRQMLLILKTNDLLRGIEATLKTRASASSFITMSRCCIKAIYQHQRKKCHTVACRLKVDLRKHWSLFLLMMYEWYLRLKGTTLGKLVLGKEYFGTLKLLPNQMRPRSGTVGLEAALAQS